MMLNSNPPLSTLTGARQTMMSWARVIETRAEIPEVFRDACKTVLAENLPFPYVVLAPAIVGSRPRSTEKLLCATNDTFYIWENIGGQIASNAYPLKSICSLEVGSILLNSWLKVSGPTGETVIPYNTATRRHINPFVKAMRPTPTDPASETWQAELAKFDTLAETSFKFMSFARESLVRGERVIQTLWQPRIREAIFTLLGRSIYRTNTLAHLAILTDKEVILIRDDEHSTENRGVRYGGVWMYIPLGSITAMEITEPAPGLLSLSLTLACAAPLLNLVFAATSRRPLEQFRAAVQHSVTTPAP